MNINGLKNCEDSFSISRLLSSATSVIIRDAKMTFIFLLKGESTCNITNEQRIKKP